MSRLALPLAFALPLLLATPASAQAPTLGELYPRRLKAVRKGTASAIEAALAWLVRHQSRDGRWDADGWTANCPGGKCTGPGINLGHSIYDAGVTGLALLALLTDGHTHTAGRYRSAVAKGLKYLIALQKADGEIGRYPQLGSTVYSHAVAAIVLSRAYTLTRDPALKKPAKKAIDYVVGAQNPNLGWKYSPRVGRNDSSVSAWMIQALVAGKLAGFEVPTSSFTGANNWFQRATDHSGSVGYESPGGGSSVLKGQKGKYADLPTMTAAGVLSRILCGERWKEDGIRKGLKIVERDSPRWHKKTDKHVNLVYWFFGTGLLFRQGGKSWAGWHKALQAALLPRQRFGGCENGSWDAVSEWALGVGRIYATAMGALLLQTPYRIQLHPGERSYTNRRADKRLAYRSSARQSVRSWAKKGLSGTSFNKKARRAANEIAKLGRDADAPLHALIHETLASVDPKLIAKAIGTLSHRSTKRRRAAAAGLGWLGVRSKAEVVAALRKALTDPDSIVRANAARSLGHLRAASAKGALQRLLNDEQWNVRNAVKKALLDLVRPPHKPTVVQPKASIQKKLTAARALKTRFERARGSNPKIAEVLGEEAIAAYAKVVLDVDDDLRVFFKRKQDTVAQYDAFEAFRAQVIKEMLAVARGQ